MSFPLLEEYQRNSRTYETQHYRFVFTGGSLAEKNIKSIAEGQEYCYSNFLKSFNLRSSLRINYYLFSSALECGKQYRLLHPEQYSENDEDEEVNGYTLYPDNVFATYNKKVKCIGYHEDVHLLMAEQYGNLESCFVKEGIATAYDKVWWGIANEYWAKKVIESKVIKEMEKLYENEEFFKFDCRYSYPVAGAFTSWFLAKYGMENYKIYYKRFVSKDRFPDMKYRKQLVEEFLLEIVKTEIPLRIEKEMENKTLGKK